jgi:hypothetical protein
MSYLSFHLDSLECHHPRGSGLDSDVVTFMVSVNGQSHGAISGSMGTYGVGAGDTVEPDQFIPIDRGSRYYGNVTEGWLIGPIYVQDDDLVTLMCSGFNTAGAPDYTGAAVDKIELKILDAYYEALAGVFTEAALGAIAEITGLEEKLEKLKELAGKVGDALDVLGIFGGFFDGLTEWALGYKPPVDCTGLAFQGNESFTGKQLRELPFANEPSDDYSTAATLSFTYSDSANHNAGCGPPSRYDVTYAVWNYSLLSFWDFKEYFWPYLGFGGPDTPGAGLRQLIPAGQGSSLRQLICC